MTAKAPTPMPEGVNRENRPKAPAAPPSKFHEGGCRHEPKTAGPRPDFPPPSPKVSVGVDMEKPVPPKPPLMRVGCNDNPCPLCGSGLKPNWFWWPFAWGSKGCYQAECDNYWRNSK